ncbi:MAG: BamA/TamA family outer membrane protein [Prolixibacteraceae bacterium]|nr:BamA/TamA family outer membrane protein [Prolixibacteraceae bacterium]
MNSCTKYIKFVAQRFCFLAAMLTIISCSTTRYVADDESLLSNVKIQIDNSDIDKEEMRGYIKQKENTKIFGFLKFHLWLYNLSSKKKDDHWLKRAGEPPQIFDEALADKSQEQLIHYLHNKGYYHGKVDYLVRPMKNDRKTKLTYQVNTGEIYRIGKADAVIKFPELERLYTEEYTSRIFRSGRRFDLDFLDRERENLANFYRNRGYYYLSKEMIFFDADTLKGQNTADLVLTIELPSDNPIDSVRILNPYKIKHFNWSVLSDDPFPSAKYRLNDDTVRQENNTFHFRNSYYKPKLLTRFNQLESNELYRLKETEETFQGLNRLKQFRFINIYFQEDKSEVDSFLLNCFVDLAPLSRQLVSFDVEGTNTSGNLGVAGNVNYTHRNLFRGAENFQLRVKGALERQQTLIRDEKSDFNTREFGVESSLMVPKLIGMKLPWGVFRSSAPKTFFSLGYNYQRRPDYTRTISSLRTGYEWMGSERISHTWNIIDFNMVALSRFNEDFLESIQDLYIKSSFTNHLIMAMNYSFVYNTQTLNTRRNYNYVRFSVESSGNLLNLISGVTNAKKRVAPADSLNLAPQEYYKFLNLRYAQYVKGDIEYRRGFMLDRFSSIVGRAFVGVGAPYGNFDVLPFEKKYFTGGANGIRAWSVRSLGPGTYKAPANSYPNQSGDIKIEANLEYRFRLVSFLGGAFFLDAGNIWAINEKDNREGAQFRMKDFYKQIALGTGMGVRFDFDFFIFRLDLGMKLRDPAQLQNRGWIIGDRRPTGNDFNLSFAIGYPF